MSESAVHPVFDRRGLYRMVAQESLSRDGGRGSFVKYFMNLQRQRMRAGVGNDGPAGWALRSDEMNAEVHEQHQKLRAVTDVDDEPRVLKMPERRTSQWAARGEEAQPPGLVVLDLTRSADPGPLTRLASDGQDQYWFTNVDRDATLAGPLSRRFVFEAKGVPVGQRCLALLLTNELIRSVGGVLGIPSWNANDEQAVLKTIAKVFDPSSLATQNSVVGVGPSAGSPKPHTVACRLAGLLKLAPAYEAPSRADGTFRLEVPLAGDWPCVQNGSFGVLCLGPMATEQERWV